MSDTKLLQTILDNLNLVDKKVEEVKDEIVETRKSLTLRIDKLGLQIANLEDDAPTVEEFDSLEKRVSKLESQAVKN